MANQYLKLDPNQTKESLLKHMMIKERKKVFEKKKKKKERKIWAFFKKNI